MYMDIGYGSKLDIYILVGFRRAVIFSVKEYTNNELTKTKK